MSVLREYLDAAACHKRNRETARRFNHSTAIRERLGSITTQGVSAPVLRADFDWTVNRASDKLKKEVNVELGFLQALERHIRQVDQHFSQQASVPHDSRHGPFDAKISQHSPQQRVDEEQSSLQQPLLPPQQPIPVQVSGVVSPPNHHASATARTNLRQSFNQPCQTYAQDIPSNLHYSPAYSTQINTQSASRMRAQPSNPPQTQTNLDQRQNYEPRIPPRSTFNPPSVHFSLQESQRELQTPRRRFEKKVESEEQTSERRSSTVPAGVERIQRVDNVTRTLPTVVETVELQQHDRSSLKHTRSPSNDCGGALTQVVDCGGEARLPQPAASGPLQKKVRALLEHDYWLSTSADIQVKAADDWKLLPGEPQPTPPESGQRPNMSHSMLTHSFDFEIKNDIDEDDDGAIDDELLCSSPVPTTKQPKHQPEAPVVQDISQTHQHQSSQAPSASQDNSYTPCVKVNSLASSRWTTFLGKWRRHLQAPSAIQDIPHAQQPQSSQAPSASQDIPHAQLSKSSQAPSASQDTSHAQLSKSSQALSASQDTSHAQLSQKPQAPSASQDTSHAQLSQKPQASSASQDTSYAQLSQKPQVPSASQDTSHAQLSQKPQVPSASQDTWHAQLSQKLQVPSASQDTWHAQLSQKLQVLPVAPTNHGPTSLLPLLPLQSTSVQRGVASLTLGDGEDGAPPQPSQSPLVNDSSQPLPWSSSPVRRVGARRQDVANALDTQDEHSMHKAIYGECALHLDVDEYDFASIVAPFVSSPAVTNTGDEELVSPTPRAEAADGTLELEADTGSTGPPNADRLSPKEQRWLDGAARSTPRKVDGSDIIPASHKCRMYLAKHPQTKARAKHYVWALFTMLGYDLPTVKELGEADFDPKVIDRILTELGDFTAFWLPASVAFHASSRAFRIAEGVAGPHPDNQHQIDDGMSALHQVHLCQCGNAHHPWQTVIHILRIGCGLFETFEADNQISHLTGVACIANPNGIVMESGMDNRARVKCHSGEVTTCKHTPPCQFISNPYEHVLQTTIELRTRLSQSLTDKVTHHCSPCNKTITGSTRDWVVHVSEHSQSVFVENSDEHAVLCPSGRNIDNVALSAKNHHFAFHRKEGRCADTHTWSDKSLDQLPPGLRSAHVGHFWRAFKAVEVDPEKLRTQILRLDYKYQPRKSKARATGVQEEQAGEDE
ncbi:hypothetical protein LTR97_001485 [Elasticomyces elasticus]|uniref:Uncharacterized protein n=1 Tax=Elasticomyces elasticus TaxID=574655 RepID=A0AAN8A545_9PEZI|nr:hypothetical protein LTR97_001485 [Elasticomyces elasticus]